MSKSDSVNNSKYSSVKVDVIDNNTSKNVIVNDRDGLYEPYESHEIFHKTITRNKLNELLNRASTGFLQGHINSILKGYKSKIQYNIKNCRNIYIEFKDKQNIEIGHISLHLDKHNSNMKNESQRKGRFHIVNNRNRNRYYTIRVMPKNKLFTIRIDSPLKMKSDLLYCSSKTIDILNIYTDENSPYFLGYRLTPNKSLDNECLVKLAGPIERKLYRSTNNNPTKKVYIPKAPIKSPWGKTYL